MVSKFQSKLNENKPFLELLFHGCLFVEKNVIHVVKLLPAYNSSLI